MGKGSKPHRSSSKGAGKTNKPLALGRSGAGRPRMSGERYANGRLKPPEPNARVLAERRLLLGVSDAGVRALQAAENPLDLMRARGWLSPELNGAGKAFAALHARARLSLPPIRVSNLEANVRAISQVKSDPVAIWRLSEIWNALAADGRSALIEVCVMEAWPSWLLAAARAQEVETRQALLASRSRAALQGGLEVVARVLALPAPDGLAAGSDLTLFAEWLRSG